MLLAGDIGGTKTLLGLFTAAPHRPRPVSVESLPTQEYPNIVAMIDAFLRRQPSGRPPVDAACFGVAGPVIDDEAELTNVGWRVDGREVALEFGLARCRLLNDLVAIASSVAVLERDELHVIQEGVPNVSGNAGLIAAGTGLGQSFLFNDGRHLVPAPSEGGHADFAPRTPREWAIAEWLTTRFGRAEVEHVISGLGLQNLYYFTHAEPCVRRDGVPDSDLPKIVSRNALDGSCARCQLALEIFVEAYGAEAGNLALRCVATRGLYVGGGIAPKILRALETGVFLAAFTSKPPMVDLLQTIPIRVILNPQAGLLGAATVANAAVRPSAGE
jgi:glucokinase